MIHWECTFLLFAIPWNPNEDGYLTSASMEVQNYVCQMEFLLPVDCNFIIASLSIFLLDVYPEVFQPPNWTFNLILKDEKLLATAKQVYIQTGYEIWIFND